MDSITTEQISPFLDDGRPEVRQMALQMLADPLIANGESLLVRAMADHSPIVWEAARGALKARQPWLILQPFPQRTPSQETMQTAWGKAWLGLRAAIRHSVSLGQPATNPDILKRWLGLPGAVPDLIEELESAGARSEARALRAQSSPNTTQILLSPTYNCNLDCAYCYAKSWKRAYPDELQPEDLDEVLSWCKTQRIDWITLAGGEPTTYRHLKRLVDSAHQNGMRVSLTTNTLYPREVQELVDRNRIELMVSHYEHDYLRDRSDLLRRYIDNIKSAQSRNVTVVVRYTMTQRSSSDEWNRVLDFAAAHQIETVTYGFSFRNYKGDNDWFSYRSAEGRGAFEEMLVSFVHGCRSRGLKPHQSKPVPLCAMSETTLRRFLLDGTFRSSCPASFRGYTYNLTINPDLTTLPCNAIGVKGPKINDFRTLEDAGAYYTEFLKTLLFHPYYEECTRCLFHYRGFCQGACLAEHYAMQKEAEEQTVE